MRYLYLPVETYSREFDPKLLLALKALSDGVIDRVIIGDQKFLTPVLRLGFLIPGIVIIKSAQQYILKTIKSLKKYGHRIVLQDEEALVTIADAEQEGNQETSRNHRSCLNLVDKIWCWHLDEYNIYARILEKKQLKKCLITGNIRTWMLRSDFLKVSYEGEITQITNNHPKFILFNSTFSQAYNINEKDTREALKRVLKLENISVGKFRSYLEWCEQTQMVVFGFLEFVRIFRASPLSEDVTLIFRPHPSDDFDFYSYIFQGLKEVRVVRKDSIAPWIFSAEVVLGSTCTTLLEASMLGKPVIAFVPKIGESIDKTLEKNIVNRVGYLVDTPNRLLECVETIMGQIKLAQSFKGEIEKGIKKARTFASWDLDTPKIQVNELKDLEIHNSSWIELFNFKAFYYFLIILEFSMTIYYRFGYLAKIRYYMFQKFPVKLKKKFIIRRKNSLGFSNLALSVYTTKACVLLERKIKK